MRSTGSPVGAWMAAALGAVWAARAEAASRPAPAAATKAATAPAKTVYTRRGSEVADLLNRWYADGTAAGNVGDYYDNRDGGHSMLQTAAYPQLKTAVYTDRQKQQRLNWALQLNLLFDHVTFGNSSTASGKMEWGSNSRRAQLSERAMHVLYRQYTHSHLYVYPEHRDHDPGHNGKGDGYGDLFHANTPYLITSQGSSGSDQPFMQAIPLTLAAFRPQVKRLLIDRGLLMPAVQMILRFCAKNVPSPAEYLTGAAHPSVFEGGNVDPLRMVRLAHAMRPEDVPPMIQLAVVEEDAAVAGRDFFDLPRSEKVFDTPAAICRIVRSTKHVHRMVVSAEASYDANGRELKFRWVVLRGDAGRITIRPLNQAHSRVELLVPYHDRRPVTPGSDLWSNRVDIGAFVHNGQYYSAPGFISLYSLDSEARMYADDGRILEVGYGQGDSTIGYPSSHVRARYDGYRPYDVTDFFALLALAGGDEGGGGLAGRLLAGQFTAKQREELTRAAAELAAAVEKETAPKAKLTEAEAAQKQATAARAAAEKTAEEARKTNAAGPTDKTRSALEAAEAALKTAQDAATAARNQVSAARRALTEAENAAHKVLTAPRAELGGKSVKDRLEKALNAIKGSPTLYLDNAAAIDALLAACKDPRRAKAVADARDGLVKWGILKPAGNGGFALSPVLTASAGGGTPATKPAGAGTPAAAPGASVSDHLTRYERNRIEWFNIAIMQDLLYPGALQVQFRPNWVNPLISAPKEWRDVYHYDQANRLTGWTRYDAAGRTEFTPDGAMVLKTDPLGRAVEAAAVTYVLQRDRRNQPTTLKAEPAGEVLHYQYASPADRVGKVVKRERVAPTTTTAPARAAGPKPKP